MLSGRRIRFTDIAAVVLFLLLFGWFFATARIGVNASEESFYITLGDRFLRGDRPLVDEWRVTQFSGFMYVIPTPQAPAAPSALFFQEENFMTQLRA